ncbi:LuxR family transcriptional regulator [Methyloligella sp. 2.7D]|nr:LuxR family transcriptional regulator [Methyloligella sp. GL2]QKP78648.1 LuxR family transcriptional regulator [Methyloligella sp. GL2]
MKVDEAVGAIETCSSTEELKNTLQGIIEDYGFSSFNMLDAGNPHVDVPFYIGTTPENWVSTYISNGFVHVDPCVARVRRSNTPFSWGDVDVPKYEGTGRKSGAWKTMEAAQDHGFREGFVVPFHYTDPLGRVYSSSSAFYWTDPVKKYRFLLSRKRYDLHLIMIYWAQRAIDIVAEQHRNRQGILEAQQDPRTAITLTDRERDVLSWAARGKTVADTAGILFISESTVETHLRHAIAKLGASNKTHGVVKAIYLGLIDV